MPISTNLFDNKCVPAIGTDINRCGAVSLCTLSVPTPTELESIFTDVSGNFRLISSLFLAQMEAKACQIKQNGLFDLITANVDTKRRLSTEPMPDGLLEIRPFLMVKREGRINNEYWVVANGQANETNWQVDVNSSTNIPSDVRWFPADTRVYIEGKTAGGTQTETAWKVVSATAVTVSTVLKIRLVLSGQNSLSNLPASKLTQPTIGVLVRGTANKYPEESWCPAIPGLNTNDLQPAWVENNRLTMCTSELYRKRFKLLTSDNKYFDMFGDIAEAKYNKQVAEDWQRTWINSWFKNKKLAGQTLNGYRTGLAQVTIPTSSTLDLPYEGTCVGYTANAQGVFEQLWECGQGVDLQGNVLNLTELFARLYTISRYRKADASVTSSRKMRIEAITDSWFAKLFMESMIRYFNQVTDNAARYIIETGKTNELGFSWDTYQLDYPNVELTVMSHEFFDDLVDVRRTAGNGDNRSMWFPYWPDIKTMILSTDRVTNKTGSVQDAALVDSSQLCVMRRPTQEVTMTNTQWSVWLSCPKSHLVVDGIQAVRPEFRGDSTIVGYSATSVDLYGAYNSD